MKKNYFTSLLLFAFGLLSLNTFAQIDAVDDSFNIVSNGSVSVTQSVLTNDTLIGVPVTTMDIVLTSVTFPAGIVLNPDGTISIAAGTPAGTYTFIYQICETANPSSCDTAVVTITVVGSASVINAVNDLQSANSPYINILQNDTLNGIAVNASQVTITSNLMAGPISIDANGFIVISTTGLPLTPGYHYFNYQICEIANPSNCSSATVTVVIGGNYVNAIDDSFININAGGNTTSVLDNDNFNSFPITSGLVNLTPLSFPAGFSINSSGIITVSTSIPAGTYTLTYQLCEITDPLNCDTATVTINVSAGIIDAVNDAGQMVGPSGGQALANVLVNDILNGLPVTLADVTLTMISTTNPGVTLDTTNGSVNIAAGTPVGNYTISYSICEILNPTNCDSATVTFSIGASIIDAVNDFGIQVNGLTGGQALANVLVNDTLNGNPATFATVNLNSVITTNPGVLLNITNGSVNVAAGVPAGTYTITYVICEILNPTNCNTAIVTIQVDASVIDAVDDTFSAVCDLVTCVSPTVFVNDSLNGASFTPSSVTLTAGSLPAGIVMNPDGTITIAAGTPAGSYTITYQICEIINPTNCDTATVNLLLLNTLLAPTGSTSQSLTVGSTITNLVVAGQNILWYANNYSGKSALFADTPLPTNTLLVNGATYYASQTISGVESTSRLPVTVTLTPLANTNFAFNDFKLFPNPVRNTLSISNASTINEVEITSILGQSMLTKKVNDLQTEINLSELSNGIYFVKVKAEGEEKTVKIIKE